MILPSYCKINTNCKENILFELKLEKRYFSFYLDGDYSYEYNNSYTDDRGIRLITEDGKSIWLQHSHPTTIDKFNYDMAKKCDYVICCYPAYIKRYYPDLNVLFKEHPLQVKTKLSGKNFLIRIEGCGGCHINSFYDVLDKLNKSIEKYIF